MENLVPVEIAEMIDSQITAESYGYLLEVAGDIRPYCGYLGKDALILADTDVASLRTANVMANLLSVKVAESEGLWKRNPMVSLRHVFNAVRAVEKDCRVLILISPEESLEDFVQYYDARVPGKKIVQTQVTYFHK